MAAPAAFFQSIMNMICIRPMNLAVLDLNLLVALDALLLEASVSRAAMRIGLSQPAASHALQRLREVLGDPLLVRVGGRMELTPRAQALRGPLAQALDQVRGLFIPGDFDAASIGRRDVFLNARHVAVVIRGQNVDLIDEWLRSKGLERRIALVVPGYIEALHIAARTDLVAFVPGRLIVALTKPLSLMAVTPPLDPGIDEQFMFYPTRAQFDPGSIWLRNLMLETGRGLDRPKRRTA